MIEVRSIELMECLGCPLPDLYVSAYSAPSALRAGMELYRAFDQDAADNRHSLRAAGKLTIPVLAVGGEISNTGSLMEETMTEVASQVSAVRIPRTGHWVAEEAPEALTGAVLAFLKQTTSSNQ